MYAKRGEAKIEPPPPAQEKEIIEEAVEEEEEFIPSPRPEEHPAESAEIEPENAEKPDDSAS